MTARDGHENVVGDLLLRRALQLAEHLSQLAGDLTVILDPSLADAQGGLLHDAENGKDIVVPEFPHQSLDRLGADLDSCQNVAFASSTHASHRGWG